MEEHKVKILRTERLTHDVKRFVVEKPAGYSFEPGQATEMAINSPEWKNERRPFTFTSLNEDPYLEFIIKGYPAHKGVTEALHKLREGDELLIHDVWGAISYQGPGVFLAGGAGITPFVAIFRQLYKDKKINGSKLIFSNKTSADIILKDEFEKMLGTDFINMLTREKVAGMPGERIAKQYLQRTIQDFGQHFYVCGPENFTESIQQALVELGATSEAVVIEK